MPSVNWDVFAALPGAVTSNFEMLCRAIIRRHYGQFGDFRALANQPGVEFHLKLHSSCSLGDAERWYGWQCKWYGLPGGQAIGSARRGHIEEAIATTEKVLPGLTDWVLWTRHPLTRRDQDWFNHLSTHMLLSHWTSVEVEEHLSGPAELVRGTYFGELVLTPEALRDTHIASVASIKGRWLPEVHQVVSTERVLQRALGVPVAWSDLTDTIARLESGVQVLRSSSPSLPGGLATGAEIVSTSALALKDSLTQAHTGLSSGDFQLLRQESVTYSPPTKECHAFARRLRAARHNLALHATNLLADIHGAVKALSTLNQALNRRMIAVIADAGFGKTHLAAQLTAPAESRPAGVLLYGRDLHARHNLNDLARCMTVNGARVESFEALVAAVDAAGQRAGCRLPIVIDGLNEAEDPRDWRSALAPVQTMLEVYPCVLLISTLRPDFVDDALPPGTEHLSLPGFAFDLDEAVARYFKYYRIDPSDARMHWRLFQHPLTLRMFCEVTNPQRQQVVGIEAMPTSLTALFERYLDRVADRIGQLVTVHAFQADFFVAQHPVVR